LLGLALPVVLVVVVLRLPEGVAAWHRLARVGWLVGIIAACGWGLSYLMRACRLRAEWSLRRPQALVECLHVTLAHNLALGLLPMRAGELGFPVLLRSRWGVGLADAGASLMLMRLQDTAVLAWLCALAAPLLLLPGRFGLPLGLAVSGSLLGLSVLGLWRLRVAARPPQADTATPASEPGTGPRWRRWLEPVRQAWARASMLTWAFSLGNWLVKLSTVASVLVLLLGLPWRAGWVGAVAGELAGAMPVQAPAGFGTYEAAVVIGLRLLHEVSAPAALGAALASHLLALCSAAALFGLLWLWRSTWGRQTPIWGISS
jgi:hypothetical protein